MEFLVLSLKTLYLQYVCSSEKLLFISRILHLNHLEHFKYKILFSNEFMQSRRIKFIL